MGVVALFFRNVISSAGFRQTLHGQQHRLLNLIGQAKNELRKLTRAGIVLAYSIPDRPCAARNDSS